MIICRSLPRAGAWVCVCVCWERGECLCVSLRSLMLHADSKVSSSDYTCLRTPIENHREGKTCDTHAHEECARRRVHSRTHAGASSARMEPKGGNRHRQWEAAREDGVYGAG